MSASDGLRSDAAGDSQRSDAEGVGLRYKIIRFRFNGENETLVRGLTLDQAQDHCTRDDTHGDDWFDGYDVDRGGES